MSLTSSIAAFLLAAAFPWAASARDFRPDIDPLARRLIEDRVAVGFVVGIYREGETQVLPYGQTSKRSGVETSGDTVYEIGSITKLFTAILTADMVQRGLLDLEAPVQDYLPASVQVALNEGQPVRLRHLVTHTSGWPRDPDNLHPVDRRNPFAHYTVEQLYNYVGWRIRSPLGEYAYSNLGMGLLGHVVTLKAGKTYEELLLAHICEPLGMRDTRPVPTADMLARLAPPYDEVMIQTRNYDLPTLAGAGGIRSTVHDLLKFIRANLSGDDTQLARAMRLSHRTLHTLKGGRGIAMAWNVSPDGRILFHTGLTGGYRAFLAVAPSRNTGIVVLSNTRNRDITDLGDQVIHIALGRRLPAKPSPAALGPE